MEKGFQGFSTSGAFAVIRRPAEQLVDGRGRRTLSLPEGGTFQVVIHRDCPVGVVIELLTSPGIS
jgi:hypothetical protein